MPEKILERRKKLLRRKKLRELLKAILEGKIDSSIHPVDKLFNFDPARQSYIGPQDRSSYDYGYMKEYEQLADNLYYK